jgi:type IV pilus assembly protein PilY1
MTGPERIVPLPRRHWVRACVALVALGLGVPPLPGRAAAAPVTLASAPLQHPNPAPPNIVLTVDDAAHMGWDFAPDYVAYAGAAATHCRDRRQCGGAGAAPGPGYVPAEHDPPLRSADYNTLFYQPTIAYAPGRRADGSDLPCEGAGGRCTGPWTAVYADGFAGYPGANAGPDVDLASAFPDTAWCRKSAPTAAEIGTAFGDGSICRRNGIPYPPSGASPDAAPATEAGYNYPNGIDHASGEPTACAEGMQCRFVHPFPIAGAPYYYTITQARFCPSANAAGWGGGECSERWDAATRPHVRFGGAAFDPRAFTRVDIRPDGFRVNGVPAPNPSGRTYAAEMANFATWHAFHRTRMLAMKTALGIAFSDISASARVGLHPLGAGADESPAFLAVASFDAAQKAAWLARLYAMPVSRSNAAPLADAMWRIGEYFAQRDAGLPPSGDPLEGPAGRCQANAHLLAVGGFAGAPLGPARRIGNHDRTVPALPGVVAGLVPGETFPRPYFEGPDATTDTLADIAMAYWTRDLRPDLSDEVGDGDAPWQHVSLHALAMGVQGGVEFPRGLEPIRTGEANWPFPVAPDSAATIDDLLHATLNGRGRFAFAANAADLAAAAAGTLAVLTDRSRQGTAAAAALSHAPDGARYVYRTSYHANGWGDVRKYALDPGTLAIAVDRHGNPAAAPLWSAADALDAQAARTGVPPAQFAGWDVRRRIVTINDATGEAVPFRVAHLSASQRASLTAGWSAAAWQPTAEQVLDYLRGDRSNEGDAAHRFRLRTHLLGDIVHSAAVAVGAPDHPYDEIGNPGYAAFRAARRARTPMVYVGANDGMLHAIVDSDAAATAGSEAWAYVPKALFSAGDPNDATHAPSPTFQLGALAFRPGGTPAWAHRFHVDATPRVADIDFAHAGGSGGSSGAHDWRTVLVGGLGAGGRAVYALDATIPVGPSETEAAIAASGRVLWEFTHPNLGYVFDAPTLVKTRRYGWVALIASGYNNPGGDGKLFVVHPVSGALLHVLSTGEGDAAAPSGLGAIRAYTANHRDPYAEQAYGGDLRGNLWRFDLASADANDWKVERIARLTDAAGRAQPVTTGVRIEIDPANGVDRYVLVGTGKLLDQSDLGDAQAVSTMYAIRDGTRAAPDPAPSTPWSRANLNAVDGAGAGGFGAAAAGTRGWYRDAADPSEKIVTEVSAARGAALFAFSRRATDPCGAALASTLYARVFATGASVLHAPGGESSPGAIFVPGVPIGAGVAGIGTPAGAAALTGSAGVDARIAVTTLKGQQIEVRLRPAGGANAKHRVSWRLLGAD